MVCFWLRGGKGHPGVATPSCSCTASTACFRAILQRTRRGRSPFSIPARSCFRWMDAWWMDAGLGSGACRSSGDRIGSCLRRQNFRRVAPWRPESGWFIDVTEDEELRSVRLDADGFASPEECRMMPRCDALWSSDGAEIVADKAIRDRDPRYRFTASAESVRVWSVYSTSQGGGEVSSR